MVQQTHMQTICHGNSIYHLSFENDLNFLDKENLPILQIMQLKAHLNEKKNKFKLVIRNRFHRKL